jgi:hypothetical protein
LLVAQLKVLGRVQFLDADFGQGMFNRRMFRINPDSYRDGCAFFVPFFAQTKKGNKEPAIYYLSSYADRR